MFRGRIVYLLDKKVLNMVLPASVEVRGCSLFFWFFFLLKVSFSHLMLKWSLFFLNRDALNLLKASPAPKAVPSVVASTPPSPISAPAASPLPPGSRPNIPPLSVPGKPGAPVITPHTSSQKYSYMAQFLFRVVLRNCQISFSHLGICRFWLRGCNGIVSSQSLFLHG